MYDPYENWHERVVRVESDPNQKRGPGKMRHLAIWIILTGFVVVAALSLVKAAFGAL